MLHQRGGGSFGRKRYLMVQSRIRNAATSSHLLPRQLSCQASIAIAQDDICNARNIFGLMGAIISASNSCISRIAVVLSTTFAFPLMAETIIAAPLSPLEEFQESFDAYPETSTRNIVGLMIGEFGDRFDKNYVAFGNPAFEIAPTNVLCMQVVTQDGRFSAANPYARSARKTASSLNAQPVSIAHVDELSTYEGIAVAVRAILAVDANCVEDDSLFLARIGTGGADETLTVQVMARNRDARLTLTLPEQDTPPMRVSCRSAAGTARLAFDRICRMELPKDLRGQVVEMTVTLDDGMDTQDTTFRAYIPDRSETQ